MKILRCPKCKSDRIEPHAALLTGAYYCRKCGYIGALVIEEEVDEKPSKLHEE
jgi:late competence protein required for DNA uptake (superfamily II DNA/RNA helicase)